ncbi:MAG: hypothetical protein ACREBW_06690, partial [Candidatus Micrarchaeaceae archaeon]
FSICPQMAFMAGKTPGYIVVSLVRETSSELPTGASLAGPVDIEAQERNDMMLGALILGGIVILIIIWLWHS